MSLDIVVIERRDDEAAAAVIFACLDVIEDGVLQVKAGKVILGLEEDRLADLLVPGEGDRDLPHDAVLRIYRCHDIDILQVALLENPGKPLGGAHRRNVFITIGVTTGMNRGNLRDEEVDHAKLLLITGKNSSGYGR